MQHRLLKFAPVLIFTLLAACGGTGGSTGATSGGSGTSGSAYTASGGTTGVTGTVMDISTGSALSGVTVSDGSSSTTTNSSGVYTLKETAGTHTLEASAKGYLNTWQVDSVMTGVTNTVNWSLTKSYGTQAIPASKMSYVVLAWNDLGMHCDQDDYSYFSILPPFNTLHAQVIKRGGEGADVMTSGITVSYTFPKKTDTALHTNFWQYAPQFGWNVPANTGITGTKLSGNMQLDSNGLGFVATGIPLSPYDDDGTWDPYGTAVLTVKDSSGNVLQTATVVAPVSTEINCLNCHSSQLDILQQHDKDNGTNLAGDQASGIVHQCAECHADNALGAAGKAGVENLSLAMHKYHADKMAYTATAAAMTPTCFNCHPGPKTQCLRGQMYRAGKTCTDCHGDMATMASSISGGRQPWLQEPKCGTCHDASHSENPNTLYRNSVLNDAVDGDMNGKIYCEACHNSTHAEFTSPNPADPTIPKQLQGETYWIWSCQVCHNSESGSHMHSGAPSYTGTTSGGTTSSGGSTDGGSTTSSGGSTDGGSTTSGSGDGGSTTAYTVTPYAGSGGSISPSGPQSVNYDATTSFTVTPNPGYSTSSVTGCGGSLSGNTYTTRPITANCTVTASFSRTTTSDGGDD